MFFFPVCHVISHNPICSCSPGYTGDPLSGCTRFIPEPQPRPVENPCVPSPCGTNSDCRVVDTRPACTCLPNYYGVPPNCRPECTINSECPNSKACMNLRCVDPCPGSCGANTQCTVINHTPSCTCDISYTGDPFQGCVAIRGKSSSFNKILYLHTK